MRLLLLIVLTTFSLADSKAKGDCMNRHFKEDKIELNLCQSYYSYNETTTLIFKARTKVLNDYIKEKILNGQLKDKKLVINIMEQSMTYEHLFVKQNENGYEIDFSGYPTIQKLTAIVDNFTKSDWKQFIVGLNGLSETVCKNQIEKFYDSISVSKPRQMSLDKFIVWSSGQLHIDYINDSLKYFLDSFPLKVNITSSPLPVQIKDRYLFFDNQTIFVLQGQEIIKTFKIEPIEDDIKMFQEYYNIYIYDKWVNLCYPEEENWIYTYSYDKNKFYKNTEK
ncbi:MAG: hypothetical protein HY063_10890 [Bacteroidetes bacterium]|nr:hypothetical protein [Bacteroidota bacterium]